MAVKVIQPEIVGKGVTVTQTAPLQFDLTYIVKEINGDLWEATARRVPDFAPHTITFNNGVRWEWKPAAKSA